MMHSILRLVRDHKQRELERKGERVFSQFIPNLSIHLFFSYYYCCCYCALLLAIAPLPEGKKESKEDDLPEDLDAYEKNLTERVEELRDHKSKLFFLMKEVLKHDDEKKKRQLQKELELRQKQQQQQQGGSLTQSAPPGQSSKPSLLNSHTSKDAYHQSHQQRGESLPQQRSSSMQGVASRSNSEVERAPMPGNSAIASRQLSDSQGMVAFVFRAPQQTTGDLD